MTTIELLKDYRKKAKRIAVLKSTLSGVFVGFCVNFILAFILLFCNVGALATLLGSIIPGVLLGVVAGFILYFLKFSPSAKKVASMVDNLGLEERIITMLERENDNSEIARLQRKDATEKLNKVNPEMFRFKLPVTMLVALITVCVLGVSMTTVSAVTTFEPNSQGGGIVRPDDPSTLPEKEIEYVELYYNAGEGGSLMGETYQRIEKGSDATPVIAVAVEGYVFDQWDDGVMTSERWDWSVVEDINVTAIFIKKQSTEGEEGETGGDKGDEPGEGEDKGDGDIEEGGEGGDKGEGQDPGEGEGSGQGDNEGTGEGQGPGQGEGMGEGEGLGGGDSQSSDSGQQQNGGGGGGGAGYGGPTDNNSVIDGSTDYKDATDWETRKQEVENDDSLPPELKDALNGYFDGMKP